jgi:hypothetical protein
VIVLSDITNEPDDQESIVRFRVYSNEFDVEALIATTSTWLRDRTSVKNIHECVAAYGKARDNLARHADAGPIWTDTRDSVTTPDGRAHVSNQATIWRWRQAYQHDFAARMDWCVADSREKANHNPIVVVEGDKTKNVLHKNVKKGQRIRLSAVGTHDPDGDGLSYRWFHYAEAGRDLLNVRDLRSAKLEGGGTQEVVVTIPGRPPRGAQDVHIILDVEDDGDPSLHAYRRVVLHIRD